MRHSVHAHKQQKALQPKRWGLFHKLFDKREGGSPMGNLLRRVNSMAGEGQFGFLGRVGHFIASLDDK